MKVSGIQERDGYVEIQVEGSFSSPDIEVLRAALEEGLKRRGGSRLLFNFLGLSTYTTTTLDRYRMGMAAAAIPKGVRIAALAPREWIDPERFGARVAQNRGATVEVFSDGKQALAWLLLKDEPPAPAPEK